MTTLSAELIEEKRDARGRQVRSKEEREGYLVAFAQSGLSQQAFAKREGIKYMTFVSWVQAAKQRKSDVVQFTQVTLPAKAPDSVIEVRLPDGSVIRGGDAAQLGELIRLIRC
jgi:hypothetical protein